VQPLPSFFDKGILQPSKVGTDNEIQPGPRLRLRVLLRGWLAANLAWLPLSTPRLLSRLQTTIRDLRGSSESSESCRTQPKLQLYVPREPTARALPRLPLITAVDERVRLPPWSQATQGLRGTSPRTTRLRLQYLARLPSRLDPTNLNDKNFYVRDLSGQEGDRNCSATRPWPGSSPAD
jgi:hypothetical protein